MQLLSPQLAEEVEVSCEPLGLLDRLDPLVHLAEAKLVPAEPLFALSHRTQILP